MDVMVTKIEGTLWRPLGKQTQPRMSAHDIVCLHTMVGYLSSTEDMFKQRGYGGTESHFGVGGIWGSDRAKNLDGVVYQWQDLDFTADANFEGNKRVISIETADNAPKLPKDILPWTPAQCAAIIKLVATLCKKYDIPAVLVKDSKPGRRGIAYHRQGIDPWRVSGGEAWSTKPGKECPTDKRIAQINSVIIPGVQKALGKKEEDELPTAKDVWAADLIPVTKTSNAKENPTWSAQNALGNVFDTSRDTNAIVRAQAAQIAALTAAVSQLAAAVGKPGSLTAAQITAASEAGAKAALAQLADALDG